MIYTTKQKTLSVIIGKKAEKPVSFFDKMRECPNKILAIDPKTGREIMTFAYNFSKSGVCSGYVSLTFDPAKSIKDDSILETYLTDYGWNNLIAGHGKAGGYGYHKMSSVFQECLSKMNIQIFGDVYGSNSSRARKKQLARMAGVGEQAVRTAMLAVCHAVGHRKIILIEC